jgi:histidinol-phosphate aminotransferase
VSWFRDNIDAMEGYVPGEQPAPGSRVIKLNTNENPYPPSPAAMEALRRLDGERLRRYSDPLASAVRAAAGRVLDVPPEWVLAGNGSDDLLTMLFRAATGPHRPAAWPAPTYTLYDTLARIQDAPRVEVPFADASYRLPVDRLAEADAALTLIANPNSPTGTFTPIDALDELAGRLSGVLVIDEAYADFAADHAVRLVAGHENVIVLRTLSKGYSLAGLRLGFGLAQPPLLAGLMKVKDSYNVDAVACAVASAALDDQPYHRQCVEKVLTERARLADRLSTMGFSMPPSQSNFLLARPPAGEARSLYEQLKRRGILVRYFSSPALADKLRITVGSAEENDALLDALNELVGPAEPSTETTNP